MASFDLRACSAIALGPVLVAALVAVGSFALAVEVAALVAVLVVLPVVLAVLALAAHLPLRVALHNFRRTLRLVKQWHRTLHILFRPRVSPPKSETITYASDYHKSCCNRRL